MRRIFSLFLKFSLLTIAFIIAGCASAPPVPVPPAFNLYIYNRVAVIPFDNNTQDPALAKALQEEMTSEIVNVNAASVIDPGQVAAYLKAVKAKASDVATDMNLRQRVAAHFKCDLLLIGSAEAYNEFLKDDTPKHTDQGWGFYTKRKVVVNSKAKIMDAQNGTILWTNKGNGWSWDNKWNPLPIPNNVAVFDQIGQFVDLANLVKNRVTNKNDEEPLVMDENSGGGLIYPKSSMFADLRGKAIYQSIQSMTGDFYGSNGWQPGSAGK